MAGLFDPSMFNPSGPQAGLFARLAAIAQQPSPGGVLPGQPGTDAQASAPQPQPNMAGAPQGGFLDALQSFLSNHQNAMMGLGAGIASGGLQQGVPGMAQGAQQDRQRQMQMAQLNSTYQALRMRGVSDSDARLILFNPEAMKSYAGNLAPQTYSAVDLNDPNSPSGKTSGILGSRTGQLSSVNPASLARTPSPAAQAAIRQTTNQQDIATFDQTYGAGAAARYRGGQ